MSNYVSVLIVFSLIIMLGALTAFAEPPQYMNYQGRLTDDAGNPITNISPGVLMRFVIWNDETLSDPSNEEWYSGANPSYVPVEDGLFDVQLGPLPANLFRDHSDLWLGITVGTDAEISPRTKLTSAAYACHAGTVDDIYVDEVGDVMTGDLLFDGLDNGETDAILDVEDDYASLSLYYDQTRLAYLGSAAFGNLSLAFSDNGFTRAALSAQPAGGFFQLMDNTGSSEIELMAGVSGDYSVVLPDDAINSDEILNEAGIASQADYTTQTLTTDISDIVTISVTIPASGYIHVEGRCYIRIYGVTTGNYGDIQIDETAGGPMYVGYYAEAGMSSAPNTGYYCYPMYVDRIFYKTAGTYEFRMEGRALTDNGTVELRNAFIVAKYYPTSYQTVRSLVHDPGDYPDPKAVTVTSPNTETEETVYEVDLRYYELRAKEARTKALEAELELRQKQIEALQQSAGKETGQ